MIQLKNVTLRRSAKVLLDAASVTINPGEKVGLVGRNGAGKSTLFALFNGTLHEDGGDFSMPKQWRLAQVAQNMPETDESATEFVLGGDTRLAELRAALHAAELSEDGMAMAHAHVDLADAGEHDAVPRAQSLILGLGFRSAELNQAVNSFSGGWRMRLQLARALMCPSDLLILDEPTNHLDLDALVWLEAWLKRYTGTMIVISHDREFLDAVTDVTLHIEHAKLNRYGGNYSAFETLRSQQLELQQASFAKQQDKIAHLQKFIARFKAKASKAKQAQSRVKALERMEKIAPVLADADFTFEFKEPQNLPNPMLAISDANLGYSVEGQDKVIVKQVNKSVLAGQRIGILGANGQGKSTLVKTIARSIKALSGELTEGKGLNIGGGNPGKGLGLFQHIVAGLRRAGDPAQVANPPVVGFTRLGAGLNQRFARALQLVLADRLGGQIGHLARQQLAECGEIRLGGFQRHAQITSTGQANRSGRARPG